jgi:hypothetical protein
MTEVRDAAVDDVLDQLRRLEARGRDRDPAARPSLRRARLRRAGWVAAVLAVVLAAWFAAAGWTLWRARGDALAATDRLERLRAETDLAQPDTARLAAELPPVAARFARAEHLARRPWVAALRPLPWVGTQVRSADALAGAAADVTDGLSSLASRVDELTSGVRDGRVDRAGAAAGARDALAAVLPRLDPALGPRDDLLPQLARAHTRLAGELDELRGELGRAHGIAAGVAAFLDGRRYLVLAANPAEMRVGSGMVLQAGVLRTDEHGELTVESMVSVTDVYPTSWPAVVDPDLAANWAFLSPNHLFQNVALTPRYDVVARQAAALWATRDPEPIDGVLSIDPAALAGLLQATGPVTVAGQEITAADIIDVLDNRQYELASDDTRRTQFLAAVTGAVLNAARERRLDVFELVRALRPAASGRHVKVWSSDAVQQRGWELAGIDGSVTPDDVVVSVSNHGTDKLDHYLRVRGEVQVDGSSSATLRVTLANTVPPGQPDYVSGRTDTDPYGRYFGLLTVELPGASSEVHVDEVPLPDEPLTVADQQGVIVRREPDRAVVLGADGPLKVVALSVSLEPGQSVTRTFRVSFDPSWSGRVRVVPSGRLPGIEWSGAGQSDGAAFTVGDAGG